MFVRLYIGSEATNKFDKIRLKPRQSLQKLKATIRANQKAKFKLLFKQSLSKFFLTENVYMHVSKSFRKSLRKELLKKLRACESDVNTCYYSILVKLNSFIWLIVLFQQFIRFLIQKRVEKSQIVNQLVIYHYSKTPFYMLESFFEYLSRDVVSTSIRRLYDVANVVKMPYRR